MRSWLKTRNGLYTFLLGLVGIGYAWLMLNHWGFHTADSAGYAFCLFKESTGMACPACGSGRSLMAITQGAWLQAFYWNPLGFLIMSLMVILPVWIVADLLTNNNSCQQAYRSVEKWLTKKKIWMPLALLILLNWTWNLMKGL